MEQGCLVTLLLCGSDQSSQRWGMHGFQCELKAIFQLMHPGMKGVLNKISLSIHIEICKQSCNCKGYDDSFCGERENDYIMSSEIFISYEEPNTTFEQEGNIESSIKMCLFFLRKILLSSFSNFLKVASHISISESFSRL